MNRFVLFIRDYGAPDALTFHGDKASAEQALVDYVTVKIGQELPSDSMAAEQAIAAYFDKDLTFYTIAGVPADVR